MQVNLYGIYNGTETLIPATSGVGYYGSAFGDSVSIGSYQDKTYITNIAGELQSSILNNTKYNATGTMLSNDRTLDLFAVPKPSGSFRLSLSNDTPIKVTSATVYIDDTISNSGVVGKFYEIPTISTGTIYQFKVKTISLEAGLTGQLVYVTLSPFPAHIYKTGNFNNNDTVYLSNGSRYVSSWVFDTGIVDILLPPIPSGKIRTDNASPPNYCFAPQSYGFITSNIQANDVVSLYSLAATTGILNNLQMTWQTNQISLSQSPGVSGLNSISATKTASTQHDWNLLVSLSPQTVGSHNNLRLKFLYEYTN